MHSEYRWVLAHLDALPAVRAVVVTGTPPAFCVGGDSAALANNTLIFPDEETLSRVVTFGELSAEDEIEVQKRFNDITG